MLMINKFTKNNTPFLMCAPVLGAGPYFSLAPSDSLWEGYATGIAACVVDGACVTGGNPANGQSQHCNINVLKTGLLSAERFNTNGGDDFLTVDGVGYSGGEVADGPQNVPVAAGDVFSFKSGKLYADRGHGWKVCLHAQKQDVWPLPGTV